MKVVVLILAVLAAAKVGLHEFLYRTATNDVIISAYRDRAVAACAKEPRALHAVQATAWEQPGEVRLVIGKPNIDVYIWQVEHRLWNARFVNPYLVIEASGPANRLLCEYDIVHATASLQQL